MVLTQLPDLDEPFCDCTEWQGTKPSDHDPFCSLMGSPEFLNGEAIWDGTNFELISLSDLTPGADEEQQEGRYPRIDDVVHEVDNILEVALTRMNKDVYPTAKVYQAALGLLGEDVLAAMEKQSNLIPLTVDDLTTLDAFTRKIHVLSETDVGPIYDCMCDTLTHVRCDLCGVYRHDGTKEGVWVPTYDRRLKEVEMFITGDLYRCTCKHPQQYACQTCKVQRWSPHSAWTYWDRGGAKTWLNSTGHPVTTTIKSTSSTGTTDWGYGVAQGFQKCRHYGEKVTLPDGTVIICSSEHTPDKRTTPNPDFGCYMAGSWEPDWKAYWLNWADYGLPRMSMKTVNSIVDELLERARAGEAVEIGCMGGHGRTGALLALLALKAGAEDAESVIKWVRSTYCNHAIEGAKQEWYIACFDAALKGLDVPEMPVEPCKKWEHNNLYRKGERCTKPGCKFDDVDFQEWNKTSEAVKAKAATSSPKASAPSGAKAPVSTSGGTPPPGASSDKKTATYDQIYAPVTWDTEVPEKDDDRNSWCSSRRHFIMWWKHHKCDCAYWKGDIGRFERSGQERGNVVDAIDAVTSKKIKVTSDAEVGKPIDLITGEEINTTDQICVACGYKFITTNPSFCGDRECHHKVGDPAPDKTDAAQAAEEQQAFIV